MGHRAHPLLCVTTSYPARADGAAGRFVALLNEQYAQRGWAPRVLCPRGELTRANRCPLFGYPLREVSSFGPIFQRGGAPDWLQRHPLRALLSAPPSALSLAFAGRRLSLETPAAARVAHWLLPSAFCFGEVHLAHAHGGDIALLERLPFAPTIAREIERRVRSINFVSQDLKRRFEALLGRELARPSSVLPMGVEPPTLSSNELARWARLKGDRALLCTVGRLTPIKGHLTLLKAISRLPEAKRSALLWVAAGEGPLEGALRDEARQRGVPLYLTGQLPPPARDALLSSADLFVLPSLVLGRRAEGCPVSLLESIVAGCPVIASDAGGVGGVLGGAPLELSSLLTRVTPGDELALSSALNEALARLQALSCDERARQRGALVSWGAQWRWDVLGSAHAELLSAASV